MIKHSGLIILLILASAVGIFFYWYDHRKPVESPKSQEKLYIDSLAQEQLKIKRYAHVIDSIRMRQYNDSIVFIARLRSYNEEIKRLKNNAQKVNLTHASAADLDSVWSMLYPTR